MDGEKPQQQHERYDATQLRAERSAEPRAGKYCESSVEPAARAAEGKKKTENGMHGKSDEKKKRKNATRRRKEPVGGAVLRAAQRAPASVQLEQPVVSVLP